MSSISEYASMLNRMLPTIQTPHVVLRPFIADDAEDLYRIYQTENILQYFPPSAPPTLERIQRFIARQQEHWDIYGYGNWGVVPSNEARVIGWAGLQFVTELNEVEVGYLLDKPYWGKGYATEAARASIQFGLEHMQLDHIIALVFADNIASRRVIEKCGMTFEQQIHIWEVDLMKNKINVDEWRKQYVK